MFQIFNKQFLETGNFIDFKQIIYNFVFQTIVRIQKSPEYSKGKELKYFWLTETQWEF